MEEEPLETNPFDPPVKGGQGLPRCCTWKGNAVPFHDGGCLMSPGRWDVDKRVFPQDKEWKRLRLRLRSIIEEAAGGETGLEKECFAMATGEKGCRLVQDEEVRQRLLNVLEEFCRSKGARGDVLRVAEGQPFRLELMRQLLEYAGDKDCEFLAAAEEGLPLGVKNPLPRTPSAFERQVEWALKYDPLVACLTERPNYPSAKEHEAHLRSHLEEEVKEGRMSRPEFEQRFGEERAVAALAVLVEDEITGKRRVIHDGSHGVRVNHRIRCQDKLRMPGGREKRFLLNRFRRARDVVFSLIGDFGKAHRRFKYVEEEHGYLACKVSEEDPWIYVNRVGTFGVASTPYWWGRLSGALLRLGHCLVGPAPLEALLYADDLETMGIGKEGRRCQVLMFVLLAALGAPFKWKKQRGGMTTEWIGLTSDFGRYSMGLSERRAAWLVQWIGGLCSKKMVLPREFSAGLGRLGFAATVLPWERPFLGPLYTWGAAIREQKGEVYVPWAVLTILDWIAGRLSSGGRMEVVKDDHGEDASGLAFYTDARASEVDACIGGYLASSTNMKECPWFSFRVDERMAPWLRKRGNNPKRMIAALELLATLVALKLWGGRGTGGMKARAKAFTDNRGNAFAVVKGMSTKYPLTLLLMELTEELRSRDMRLDLEWIKRDENTLADALSNEDWSEFDESLREVRRPEEIGWKVLDQLQVRSDDLYSEIQSLKEQRSLGKARKAPVKTNRAAGKVLPKW